MIPPFDRNPPLSLMPSHSGNNNVDIDHLIDLVTRLYHPHMDRSFYIQLYVCAALVVIMLPVGTLVLWHRFRLGRAWFLKIWPVAGGTFVLPNAVVVFLLCEGCFGILWVTYVIISVGYYHDRGFQKNYFLWKSLIWVPLWVGGWWTGFGFLSAFPDALTHRSKRGMQKRLILSPCCFNAICWFVPVLLLASLLPPAVLAARKYNSTLDDYGVWRKLAEAARQGSISDGMSSALRAQALVLWLDVTKAYWYFGICMACWCFWAAICLLVYVPVGGHTLWRIREQLLIAKDKYRSFHNSSSPFRIVVTGYTLGSVQGEVQVDTQVRPSGKVNVESALPQDFLVTPPAVICKDHEGQLGSQRYHGYNGSISGVYPPIELHYQATGTRTVAEETVEQRRIGNLERVYKNLSVQFYGICAAIVCFLISATIYAVDSYAGARIDQIALTQVRGNLSAAYVIVCFGYLTVIAIFWRSLDPSLSIDMSEEAPAPVASGRIFATLFKRILRLCRSMRTVETRSAGEDGAAYRFPPSTFLQLDSNGLQRTHSSHTIERGSIGPHREWRKLDRQCSHPKLDRNGTAGPAMEAEHSTCPANVTKVVLPVESAVAFQVTPFDTVPATSKPLVQEVPDVIELRSFSPKLDSKVNGGGCL